MSALFPELAGHDDDAPDALAPAAEVQREEVSAATRALQAAARTRVGLHAHVKPALEPASGDSGHARGADESEGSELGVHREEEVRIARPGLAAGAESLLRFERAFGLSGSIRSLKKTEGDEIELVVELEDGRLAAGSLVPPTTRAWKQGKSFGITYRGAELPSMLAKALMRFMALYDGVPFDKILAQIVPEAGDEHMLHNDYVESVFYAFAPSSGWRRFFEGTELYRGACGTQTGNVAIIDHTDIECIFNVAPYDNRLPGFFNVPTTEADADGANRTATPPGFSVSGQEHQMFTDIQDRDVIKGADKLLDEALETLADHPNRPEMVFVQSGCLPDVTGDDLEASVARTSKRLRLPVVVVGIQNDPVSGAMSQLVDTAEIAPDRALDPGSIALIGVPDFAGRRSLDELLARAGISVLTAVLPNLDRHAIELLSRAEVLVGYPWDRHRETAGRLAQRLAPARSILPGAPFGVSGTSRWLEAIGEAVGRSEAVKQALAAELEDVAPRWRALRARARRYRVGFIVDQPNWRGVLNPNRTLGVPMLPMLREMGFGVDVLVYAGTSTVKRNETHAEGNIRVRSFRSCAELDARLAETEVVAWYTEMLYDRRLTRNGKNPFSLRQFRMGLRGALESLNELVRLAELPFYRRYSRYLGRAFTELGDSQ